MRTTPISRKPSQESVNARAALEALFGNDSAPAAENAPIEGDALVARKAAEAKTVASRIDLLRRKREAMIEIQREAAARGITLDDLRSA